MPPPAPAPGLPPAPSLRARLAGGAALLGTFVKSPDPLIAEALAGSGLDFLIADLEHSSLGLRDLEGIVRSADVAGVPVIARLAPEALAVAGRALEAGAVGMQVSGVSSPAAAAAARAAITLPPGGSLGLSLSHRAARFGAMTAAQYAERLSGEIVLIGQIETRAALEALPGLLAAGDGPDAWFLGPMDLSAHLGRPGQPAHPEVRAQLVRAAEAIRAAGRPLAVFAVDEQDAHGWRAAGATLVAVGSDLALLSAGARRLAGGWRVAARSSA